MKYKKLLEQNSGLVRLLPKEVDFYIDATLMRGRSFNNDSLPENFPFNGKIHASMACSIVCLMETKRNVEIAPMQRDAKPFIDSMSKNSYEIRKKSNFGSHNCDILHDPELISENTAISILRFLVENAELHFHPAYYQNFKKKIDSIALQLPKIEAPKKVVVDIEESETSEEIPVKKTAGRKKKSDVIESDNDTSI